MKWNVRKIDEREHWHFTIYIQLHSPDDGELDEDEDEDDKEVIIA